MKITLTSVFVHDPITAFQFYTEVLGFIERLYLPEARLVIVASPEEPEGTGLLLEPNDNPIARTYQAGLFNEGLPVIVFGTDDVQQEYDRLSDLGVVFRQPPTTCGNLIQLFQV